MSRIRCGPQAQGNGRKAREAPVMSPIHQHVESGITRVTNRRFRIDLEGIGGDVELAAPSVFRAAYQHHV